MNISPDTVLQQLASWLNCHRRLLVQFVVGELRFPDQPDAHDQNVICLIVLYRLNNRKSKRFAYCGHSVVSLDSLGLLYFAQDTKTLVLSEQHYLREERTRPCHGIATILLTVVHPSKRGDFTTAIPCVISRAQARRPIDEDVHWAEVLKRRLGDAEAET